MSRGRLLPFVLALALVAAWPAAARAGYASGATQEVSMKDDFFDPEAVHVVVGTTIEWPNEGRNPHTVTADDGSFDSGNVAPGGEFTRTFAQPGAYAYYCRYHGAPGVGMAGVILVGDAQLPVPSGGQVGPGREPVPTGPGSVLRVIPPGFGPVTAGTYPTIQAAVDAARPGDLVLVSPGEYHEAVKVTTPYITIRGTDRNTVILDGDFKRPNGIHVIEADGVAVQNITARHYLLNGFYWTTVFGYLASYVTAYDDGDYGVYAFDSVYGRFEHSYASGHPDSGFYIGQCRPCHALIDDVLAERNGIGYSGTNAGGDLSIVNSTWRLNQGGIVPNTLDSEANPPQRGAYLAGNRVYDNNNQDAPAKDVQAAALGTGILLAGGDDNVVEHNVVWDHGSYGIEVSPILDKHIWIPQGNVVRDNLVRGSGRADLVLAGPAGAGNCFSGNDFHSSLPPAIQVVHGCGFDVNRAGGGDLSATFQTLALFIRVQAGGYPQGDWKTQPAPPSQPTMPPPASCPAGAPCPESAEGNYALAVPNVDVPGTFRVAWPPSSSPPSNRQEVTVIGVSIAAPTWWGLLLATYAYLLPLILYVAWVSIAMWDLIRREEMSNRRRIWWMATVLLVPLIGPILYFVLGRSPIPRSVRTMLLAGGLGIYILFAVLSVAAGS